MSAATASSASGPSADTVTCCPLVAPRPITPSTLLASTVRTPAVTDTTHNGEGALDRRGTLYVLAVGVDEYPGVPHWCGERGNESCDLRYAGSDAAMFAAAALQRAGADPQCPRCFGAEERGVVPG